MFDFPFFITLLISIFAIYFPLYFNFKKEIDDLKFDNIYNSKPVEHKIYNRKKKIRSLNIITTLLAIVVVLLYTFPFLSKFFSNSFSNVDLTFLSGIGNFFAKYYLSKKASF